MQWLRQVEELGWAVQARGETRTPRWQQMTAKDEPGVRTVKNGMRSYGNALSRQTACRQNSFGRNDGELIGAPVPYDEHRAVHEQRLASGARVRKGEPSLEDPRFRGHRGRAASLGPVAHRVCTRRQSFSGPGDPRARRGELGLSKHAGREHLGPDAVNDTPCQAHARG